MKNIVVLGCCRSGHNFVMEQIKSWSESNQILFYNLEDCKPQDYDFRKSISAFNSQLFNPNIKTINIIVVRDLLNWWASYLKWITKDGTDNYLVEEKKLQNAFDIWNDIVKENFSITDYITHKVCIDYDSFNAFKRYRWAVCRFLGGIYNERSLDMVVSAGGGSSFDSQKIAGSEMKTGSRYKQILKKAGSLRDLYIKMLRKNVESIDLYEEYFDITEDQKTFLKVL